MRNPLDLLAPSRRYSKASQGHEMAPGVPGSSSAARRPENRRPGGQRWQALDGTMHRTRADAVRADKRTGNQDESGPVLVAVLPRRPMVGLEVEHGT